MFIEKRRAGKKTKYYLVHSFRYGKKVRKLRKYLGTSLGKEKLGKVSKIAEQQILHRMNVFKKINDPLLEVLSEEEIKKIKELEANKSFRIFHRRAGNSCRHRNIRMYRFITWIWFILILSYSSVL